MSYVVNNDFADWIYNRYVEFLRKKDLKSTMVFLDVLEKYISTGLTERKFSRQRRHANGLLKTIYKAMKTGKSDKLELTGKEWTQEFEKKIKEYEKSLIDMGFDEETIEQMVIEKKYNYGND
jgi:predicted transcriptional regulator